MVHPHIAEQRAAWERKSALRAVYADYIERMRAACVDGPTVEVGAGAGQIGELWPGVIVTDLLDAPWLQARASAEALPFRTGAIANVVALDVLHHLPHPRKFFEEVARVLRPGGRCVLLDPAITPGSWPFFKLFHPEPVDLSVDPLAGVAGPRDPFDANQAIPTLLFARGARAFEAEFPGLSVKSVERLSFAAYPLSGGFRPWSLVPNGLVRPLLGVERALEPLLGRLAAFRLLVVVERRAS